MNTLTKWTLICCVCMMASVGITPVAYAAKASETTVATVNGTPITRQMLDRSIDQRRARLAAQGQRVDPTQLAALEKQVLEELINGEILYQESVKRNITIADTELNEQWMQFKSRFPDQATFDRELKQRGLSESALKEQMRRSMQIQKLVTSEFIPKITVTDAEIRAFYDQNQNLFREPEAVKASHILIKVDPPDDKAADAKAFNKIQDLKKKLDAGEDFAALAKAESEGPSSVRGGSLGFFRRGQMVKPFEDKAFAMKVGDISDPVKTRFGYHLILVEDRKSARAIPYEESKDRIRHVLTQQQLQKDVFNYIESAKKTAKIERMVK